jgi:hypothetical protein
MEIAMRWLEYESEDKGVLDVMRSTYGDLYLML